VRVVAEGPVIYQSGAL